MTNQELRTLILESKDELDELNNGEPAEIYLHWTAGHYGQAFCRHYHFCVDRDGEIDYDFVSLAEVLEHTWHRNTGNIGIALECCVGARVYDDEDGRHADLGAEPSTEAQIRALCRLCAVLCKTLDIPVDNIKTHAEVAEEDGYGLDDDDPDCRWDLAVLHEGDKWGTGGEQIRQRVRDILEEA